jgi:hypothetical protein
MALAFEDGPDLESPALPYSEVGPDSIDMLHLQSGSVNIFAEYNCL